MALLDSSIDAFRGAVSAVLESPVGPFAQELFILAAFGTSFLFWRQLGRRPRTTAAARRAAKLADAACAAPPPEASCGAAREGLRRAQGGARRAAAAVPAAPAAPCRSVDSPQAHALEKQMLKHLELREFTRALNLYRSLERDSRDLGFSEELYSSFVQSAVRVGQIDVVERMVRTMKHQGLNPSTKFWQTTMKMLSSRKHFSACLSLHTVFARQMLSDKTVYSCLINAALEVGDPERAMAMLHRYGSVALDTEDYILFFRTYVALNDVDSAEATFTKLGPSATTLMLNLLLLTCVNARQPERGLNCLQKAHAVERPEAKIVDVVSYNTIIKGFAQAGLPQRCAECANDMVAKGIEPDDITFCTLLDACIVDDRASNAAAAIVDLLARRSNSMDATSSPFIKSLIKGLVRADCVGKALELYDKMKNGGGERPDIVTYSMLIKTLIDRHDLDRALQLFEDMKEVGHQADDVIITHLLEGCRHAGNLDLGKELFGQLLARGVKPSEYTLASMLKLHGRCGAHREAHDLLAGWQKAHNAKPTVIHYTCLMSGCMRTKSYDMAWEAYELMCASGIKPDGMALSTLLPGMVAAQKWDCAIKIARVATADGKTLVPAEMLNNALSQFKAAGGQQRLADEMRGLMAAAGVSILSRGSAGRRATAPRSA